MIFSTALEQEGEGDHPCLLPFLLSLKFMRARRPPLDPLQSSEEEKKTAIPCSLLLPHGRKPAFTPFPALARMHEREETTP